MPPWWRLSAGALWSSLAMRGTPRSLPLRTWSSSGPCSPAVGPRNVGPVGGRVGIGFDVRPFSDEPGRRLVLGGVELPGERGLAGHSDADVVAHAVADALLGPAGLGDLGTLFPASDDRYRDVSSLELLRDVARRVAGTGWWVVNVDVVIAAERPRLAPHMEAI